MPQRLSGAEATAARLEHANAGVTSAMNAYRMALLKNDPTGAIELRCSRALHDQLQAFERSQAYTRSLPKAAEPLEKRVDDAHARVQDRRAGNTTPLFGRNS